MDAVDRDEEHLTQDDPLLEAMRRAVGALRQFSGHTDELAHAFDRAAARRERGASCRELTHDEGAFVEFTSGPLKELLAALSDFRRRQAHALREEGMTLAELGRLLGVTRQRVAVLLDDKRPRRGA
jgi:hypothetical protein